MIFATPPQPQPALSTWSRVWRYLVAVVVGLSCLGVVSSAELTTSPRSRTGVAVRADR